MEIVHVEQLTNQKWLNLFAASYRDGDREGRWVFASRKSKPYVGANRADAAIIVPILLAPDQPPRLVLEKEYRVPIGDYVYAFPAGMLEEGEDIEATVRREMLEETGLDVVRIKRVTPPLYSSAGLTDETAALVFVDVRATPGSKPKLDGMEDIEVILLDYDQVCRMCDNTTVRFDTRAWTVLYMYQQLGRLL
jgi:ADP-ribose pyrophosphatase